MRAPLSKSCQSANLVSTTVPTFSLSTSNGLIVLWTFLKCSRLGTTFAIHALGLTSRGLALLSLCAPQSRLCTFFLQALELTSGPHAAAEPSLPSPWKVRCCLTRHSRRLYCAFAMRDRERTFLRCCKQLQQSNQLSFTPVQLFVRSEFDISQHYICVHVYWNSIYDSCWKNLTRLQHISGIQLCQKEISGSLNRLFDGNNSCCCIWSSRDNRCRSTE